MLSKESLKKKVIEIIDSNREEIIKVSKEIYKSPELGFKEFKTTKIIVDFLENLNLGVEKNIAITGCIAEIKGKEKGCNVAILGELDSVSCKDHNDCSIEGNVHACGHNIQIAGMLGAALGLVKSGVMDSLNGS
ncbi:MAG: amidohydrolase, partial [Cetobacterium sp.]